MFLKFAGKVVGEVKKSFNTELCTQAWCKFHEILASFDVVPPSALSDPSAAFSSVHLCEAPGAFITSLNHFLVSRGRYKLETVFNR
jgi:cap2 methyltransferase